MAMAIGSIEGSIGGMATTLAKEGPEGDGKATLASEGCVAGS